MAGVSQDQLVLAERTNKHRIERVLAYADQVLATLFRGKWDQKHPSDIWKDDSSSGSSFCSKHPGVCSRMPFQEQRTLIKTGDTRLWDTTLLVSLLSNTPLRLSAGEKKAVKRVQAVRNKVSHAPGYRLTDTAYNTHLSSLRFSLAHLGGDTAHVDGLLAAPLDKDTRIGLQKDPGEARRVAKDHKEEGNRCFGDTRYSDACRHYGCGIALGGVIPAELCAQLYCNRSLCRLKLDSLKEATHDAQEAVRLDPTWVKAHRRLADVLRRRSKFGRAAAALERALAFSPAPSAERNEVERDIAECRHAADKRERREELCSRYGGPAYLSRRQRETLCAAKGVDSNNEAYDPVGEVHPAVEANFPGLAHTTKGHAAMKRGDAEGAVREFTVAATEYGHPEGIYNLAVCLANGTGTAKDLGRALHYLRRASECSIPENPFLRRQTLGIAEAHDVLGRWHDQGIAVPQDDGKALDHWKKSAELECPGGWNNLGLIYLKGSHGVSRDVNRARDLFRRSAELGAVTEAMTNLAGISCGEGDIDAAIRWAQAALDHGDARAEPTLAEYKRMKAEMPGPTPELTPEQRHVLDRLRILDSLSGRRVSPVRTNPTPTLEELEAIDPTTPYLRRLISAKRLIRRAAAMQDPPHECVAMAARAYRIPDAQLVFSSEEGTLLRFLAAEYPGLAGNADRACFESSQMVSGETTVSLVARYGELVRRFPNDRFFATQHGCFLLFSGPACHIDRGIAELTRALGLCAGDGDDNPVVMDLLYLLGAAHMHEDDDVHKPSSLSNGRARDFFVRFLKHALSDGHRKVGMANFQLAHLEMTSGKDLEQCRAFYEAGVAADDNLPTFLRESPPSPWRQAVEAVLAVSTLAPSAGETPARPPFGGDVLQRASTRVHPPSDFLARLRQKVGGVWVPPLQLPPGLRPIRTTTSSVHQRTEGHRVPRAQAAPISIDELFAARRDCVHLGRCLSCVVVSPAAVLSAAHLVVEDCKRVPVRVAVYGFDAAMLTRLCVGRALRIYDPYSRFTQDGQMVRVDDTQTVEVIDAPHEMCWYCLKVFDTTTALKVCSACRVARYCGKDCQVSDRSENNHKQACQNLRSRVASGSE